MFFDVYLQMVREYRTQRLATLSTAEDARAYRDAVAREQKNLGVERYIVDDGDRAVVNNRDGRTWSVVGVEPMADGEEPYKPLDKYLIMAGLMPAPPPRNWDEDALSVVERAFAEACPPLELEDE